MVRRWTAKAKGSFCTSLFSLAFFLILSACSGKPTSVPTTFTEVADNAVIYPDYRDVTIPPNIAPLNFMVSDSLADAFVAEIGGIICGADADGKIDIDIEAWRNLLEERRGKDVSIHVYAHRAKEWVHHPAFTLHVAEEPIDSFVTYRLIEPGYEYYMQLGIYQRNLTNFDVTTVYENNRDINTDEAHCINCHNFQNNDTQRMLLHVRENHKGTIITHGTEAHKIIIKHDSIVASGAYAHWHPTLPLIAFSSNRTAQVFHLDYPEKIEVYDWESDLILYDADRNEVKNIIRTPGYFETFPCWSADGTRLYYCSARVPQFQSDNFEAGIVVRYDSLHYDLYSMPFDTVTYTFGQPRLEVDASSQNLSCSVPRVSPDGRYLLFALARYGQFHLYHKSADLWVKPLSDFPSDVEDSISSMASGGTSTESLYPLTLTNSPDADSYHSWSSNSRWIVFSSRRDDGDYTRTYIAYIDAQGQGHRAFLLPQRDPEYNLLLLRSFNVPELTRSAIPITQEQMGHVILHTEAELATFKE